MKKIFNSKKEEDKEKDSLFFENRLKFAFCVAILVVAFSVIWVL